MKFTSEHVLYKHYKIIRAENLIASEEKINSLLI